MFTPWATAQLLKDLPDLRITADFSHWCCVCESLLEDQADNLKLAFERTIHIHSRVGYPEGPQVPHPAIPEYARELEVHEGWWQQIVDLWDQKNITPITLTQNLARQVTCILFLSPISPLRIFGKFACGWQSD